MKHYFFAFCLVIFIGGCNKLVQVSDPTNTITSVAVFNTDANANAAISGIYSDLSYNKGSLNFVNSALSQLTGLSSDEISIFNNPQTNAFQNNNILSSAAEILNQYWTPLYNTIYRANAAIEGLEASSSVSSNLKKQLIGEGKFIRAFCNFYLVNLFGDVPLVTTTEWAKGNLSTRVPVVTVYNKIVSDLQEAILLLPDNYTTFGGERIRVNKWAAMAMLARVYLFIGDWGNAEIQSTFLINNSTLFSLGSLDSSFLKNNLEAIWQLQVVDASPWATKEGNQFIPAPNSSPRFYLTNYLLSSFESGDKRKDSWLKTITYQTKLYYYPYKYKIRQATSGNITEYYTLLRLSEQFLIRSEARYKLKNDKGAIADLNVIRKRAGLIGLPDTLMSEQVERAIAQERRIELFAELGHRWFDLKRTGKVSSVLSLIKNSNWQDTDQLYPIPTTELQRDRYLVQNPGY